VDLNSVSKTSLATLHACSGLTPEGFSKWLSARTSGIVLLSGRWLFKQVPAELQRLYFKALAEQGYLQAAEGAEHMLLIAPHGLRSLQHLLQEAELQAMQGSSSGEVDTSSSPRCEGGDLQARRDQGRRSGGLDAVPGIVGSTVGSASSATQPAENDGGTGQAAANTATAAADSSAALLPPVDTCYRIALPSDCWWDRGQDESRISNAISESDDNSAVLAVTFTHEQGQCALNAVVEMQACLKQKVRCLLQHC
jgi:hypothetical protein